MLYQLVSMIGLAFSLPLYPLRLESMLPVQVVPDPFLVPATSFASLVQKFGLEEALPCFGVAVPRIGHSFLLHLPPLLHFAHSCPSQSLKHVLLLPLHHRYLRVFIVP